MSLVNFETLDRIGSVTVLELISLISGWVPESSVVDRRDVQILGNSGNPRGYAVDCLT